MSNDGGSSVEVNQIGKVSSVLRFSVVELKRFVRLTRKGPSVEVNWMGEVSSSGFSRSSSSIVSLGVCVESDYDSLFR